MVMTVELITSCDGSVHLTPEVLRCGRGIDRPRPACSPRETLASIRYTRGSDACLLMVHNDLIKIGFISRRDLAHALGKQSGPV